MSEDNGKPLAMPESYNATVAAFKRFEQRSGVKLFEALADVVQEVGEGVDGISFAKAVFTDSESLAAFIYECGLSEKQREAVSYGEWLSRVTVADLFGEYDKALTALFTSSPPQKPAPRETGSKETAKTAEKEAEVKP